MGKKRKTKEEWECLYGKDIVFDLHTMDDRQLSKKYHISNSDVTILRRQFELRSCQVVKQLNEEHIKKITDYVLS